MREDAPATSGRKIATGIHRDSRVGLRTVIQCRVAFPGIGTTQKQITNWWPEGTPLETMQRWRVEAKPVLTAQLQAKIDAPLRELEKLKAAKAPRLNPKTPAASFSELREELRAAQRRIVELRETAAKLHDALRLERRRAELAEASAREIAGRAYGFAAAAGGRR
jgi:hypothetical protein